ncbi:HAD family hydrolase [Chelativorans alearense]|uniref:HAD family hydrolase n=1 Tax=Chelativorans alearense TaxID=2681495 RepID=UPI0013D76B7E|nr:HAD family hydrolase [Chelativorans alearense]
MESRQERPAVLFDLDGTLTDPFVGITGSLRHVMEKMGRTAPAAEDLRACIGPPIQDTFARLLETADEALVWEAVGHYRQRYGEVGKFENEVIPGIPDALARCVDAGFFLSVATSKVETYTGDILAHFDLARFFDAVHGSALDGTNSNKADLIRHILDVEPVDPTRTVMIGDRSHDIVGAKANALPAIGVLWGFGERTELTDAGAAEIVTHPRELPRAIGSLLTPLPA